MGSREAARAYTPRRRNGPTIDSGGGLMRQGFMFLAASLVLVSCLACGEGRTPTELDRGGVVESKASVKAVVVKTVIRTTVVFVNQNGGQSTVANAVSELPGAGSTEDVQRELDGLAAKAGEEFSSQWEGK